MARAYGPEAVSQEGWAEVSGPALASLRREASRAVAAARSAGLASGRGAEMPAARSQAQMVAASEPSISAARQGAVGARRARGSADLQVAASPEQTDGAEARPASGPASAGGPGAGPKAEGTRAPDGASGPLAAACRRGRAGRAWASGRPPTAGRCSGCGSGRCRDVATAAGPGSIREPERPGPSPGLVALTTAAKRRQTRRSSTWPLFRASARERQGPQRIGDDRHDRRTGQTEAGEPGQLLPQRAGCLARLGRGDRINDDSRPPR